MIRSAKERFGKSPRSVMGRWGIDSRASVGEVYLALQLADVEPATPNLKAEDFSAPLTLADLLDTS